MPKTSGIGLETSILLAKNGGSVLMADYNKPALIAAHAKAKELVPDAKIEFIVSPDMPSLLQCLQTNWEWTDL